jgi:DNA repair protein RecO (recombination protein O)
MEWSDEGLVLSARRHGENGAVVTLLTVEHGRHSGLARGAHGRTARGLYQPGNHVTARWRGRLPEHLGNWTCELIAGYAAATLDDPGRLSALSSACAMLDAALPEREPAARVFADTLAFVAALALDEGPDRRWPATYARWELQLLADLGFGLDLSACAATGVTEDLVFVSPKSGRSVSAAAGAPYRDKLLVLPEFLKSVGVAPSLAPSLADVKQALRLTGYFLERHVFAPHDRTLPPARTRLIEALG